VQQFVLVQPQLPEGYKAQAMAFPNIAAVGATEALAVEQVREQLTERLAGSRLVAIDIAISTAGNPLLELAGKAKDDPDFALYLQEIQRYRQEVEARECSNSSSTSTTPTT
jgi:hypothetical protein